MKEKIVDTESVSPRGLLVVAGTAGGLLQLSSCVQKRHRDMDGYNSLAPTTSSTIQTRMKNYAKRQFEKCLNFNSNIIILFRDFLYRILHSPSSGRSQQCSFGRTQCCSFMSLRCRCWGIVCVVYFFFWYSLLPEPILSWHTSAPIFEAMTYRSLLSCAAAPTPITVKQNWCHTNVGWHGQMNNNLNVADRYRN